MSSGVFVACDTVPDERGGGTVQAVAAAGEAKTEALFMQRFGHKPQAVIPLERVILDGVSDRLMPGDLVKTMLTGCINSHYVGEAYISPEDMEGPNNE